MTEFLALDRSGIPCHPHVEHGQRLFPVWDCATNRWLVRSKDNYLIGWLPPSLPFTFEEMAAAELWADWQGKAMRVSCRLENERSRV